MLKKVFETVEIPYFTRTTYEGEFLLNVDYHVNIEPYVNTLSSLNAVFVHPIPSLYSPNSIYVLCMMASSYWPSWDIQFLRFDSVSGEFIARISLASDVGAVMLSGATRSRAGHLYFGNIYGNELSEFTLGVSLTQVGSDVPETPNAYSLAGEVIPSSRFGLGNFGNVALDEISDTLLNTVSVNRELYVYALSTGVLRFKLTLSDYIQAITLEDETRVYILLGNRTLILFDYVRNEVLGAVRMPVSPYTGSDYLFVGGDVQLGWDSLYRRLRS